MCKHLNFRGICDLWDDTTIQFEHIIDSCDEFGYCLLYDDEDPIISCEDYEE